MELVADLIARVRIGGSKLYMSSGRVIFTAHPKISTPDKNKILEQLKARKSEIVNLLMWELAAKIGAATEDLKEEKPGFDSYEVAPGVRLHSPRTDPEFLAWREKMGKRREK